MSGWTTDTLRAFLIDVINEHDKRYEQRFLAQESAVQAALVAQEKAVNAALTAADRAVAKAEQAQERRNEATNEFRGQLADQAATLIPRREVEQLVRSLTERMDVEFKASDNKIEAIVSRLDRGEGLNRGTREAREETHASTSQLVAMVSAVIFGLGFIVSLVALILYHR